MKIKKNPSFLTRIIVTLVGMLPEPRTHRYLTGKAQKRPLEKEVK